MRAQNSTIIIAVCVVLISLVCQSVGGNRIDSNNSNPDEEHQNEVPKIFDYGKYVEKFRKSYGPLETLYKAKLFFGRTFKIFQHNVLFMQKKVAYFLTQNIFTDMPASELRLSYVNKEPELVPVVEALKNPDLPADRLVSIRRLKGEQGEGFSQASLDDLSKNAKYDASTQKVKPVLNFMDNQNDVDMKVVLRELKQMPEFASRAAEIVDLKGDDKFSIEKHRTENRQQIQYKPLVPSNNDYYEPQEAVSYGTSDDAFPTTGKNYANFLMGEPDFELNLAPYPRATPDDYQASEREEDQSTLTKLMNSVKGLANSLFGVDDDDDDYNDNDMKAEEKPKDTKVPDSVEKQLAAIKAGASHNQAEYNYDYRQSGCISPIQNQKSCDSCYAFAVLGLMEYFYCFQTKQLTTFSAQFMVDCGSKVNLNGCRGSKIGNVGQFIRRYGIQLDAKYPYNSRENDCPYDFEDSEQELKSGYLRPNITHWQNFWEMVAWYKWIRKSPVIVGINMPADFLAYGGGVHDGLDCVNDMTHAMLLVGSGIQDGREFWLLKNSFSGSWGEEGYFKLSKSAPLRCFNSAIVARAKFIKTQN